MTFIVEGVTRQDDPDGTVRRIGAYETREEAIAVAKATVDAFLHREHGTGMRPSELYSRYQERGEHPAIFRDDGTTLNVRTFDHLQYATLRCAEVCGGENQD